MSYYTEATIDVFNTIMSAASGLTDIVGTVKRGKNTAGYLNRSSIMKASKDLVMSFPVICPDTVTPATAGMIVKAIERNCVTTLQLLFSAANLSGMSGMDVIQKWHKNMDDSFDMDDFLDAADSISAAFESDDVLVRFATKFSQEMIREFAANNRQTYPVEDFAEQGISRFTVTEGAGGDVAIHEINLGRLNGSSKDIVNPFDGGAYIDSDQFNANMRKMEYDLDVRKQKEAEKMNDHRRRQEGREYYQRERENAQQQKNWEQEREDRLKRQADEDKYREGRDKVKDKLDQDNLDINRAKAASQIARNNMQNQIDQTNLFHQQLLSSDVRKCNELVPSMMIVRFNAEVGDTGNYEAQQFIAGVKARLIACSSMEIIDAIRATVRSKVNLLNLVRATTKEISFCRDFVAAVDQAKIDAKRNSNLSKTSPIWRSLQWRSNKSVMNRLRRHKPNDAGAITTLVLTSEEVNYMKSEYNIDLNVPNKAKEIMEAYNLMCFCIVDEEVEVVRFLFDGEKYFQDYSFQSLEKETGDTSYKKVINLMSKISR